MARDDSNGFGIVKRPNGTTRIRYVEPNDIYGEINGVPTTPDYTDYCIWCNLVVEKYSRIKSGSSGQSNRANSTTYNFFWDATKTDGTHWISFMKGRQDGPDYNYLTTDYTEIDFNEVKERNFIEGLGIESVSIAMNNYYVPEITINFVDVRGSGFFSREEATHDTFDLINLEKDKYGNLTDNFYSCFVSFPYPRFKLQVKGFYGRPVTYQLTCSSFTGSLDSATGNFKLTAKFIGYFYGIMADIPYEYLVAAPYCAYEGSQYWDEHVKSPEWALDEHRQPVKLFEFYEKIRDAMQTTEGRARLMGDANNDTLENYKLMAKKLNFVKVSFGIFKEELKRTFADASFECNTANSNQLILVSNTNKVKIPSKVCERYKDLINALDEYTKEYGSSYKTDSGETLDNSKRPGTQEDKWTSGETLLTEFFRVNSGKLYCALNNRDLSSPATSLKGLKLPTCSPSNSDGSKQTELSEDISKAIVGATSKHSDIISNNWLYACAIDFHRIEYTIGVFETKLALDLERIQNELSEKQTQSIISYFGFAPYVGNFFKIVMCHLETFVAIMYKVAKVIQEEQIPNGDRDPHKLGLTNVQTDVSNKLNFIPPWPAVYKDKKPYEPGDSDAEDTTTKYDTFGDDSDTRGWVGDAVGTVEWEERTMLMAFYNAILKVSAEGGDGTDLSASAPSIMDDVFPSVPSDLYTGVPKYAAQSKQKLAAYLGIRLMQICALYNRGSVNERYAKAFAILDAYNFFKQVDCYSIKSLVSGAKGDTIGDELYNLMLAKETGHDEHLSYEFTKVVNDRHPIFTENGANLTYSYMNTMNGIPILPITVSDLTQAEMKKYFKDNGGGRFTPEYDHQNQYSQLGNGFQYTGSTRNLLNNYDQDERNIIKNDYQNPSLFYTVIGNDTETLDRYNEMFTTGNFSSGNADFDDVLKENKKILSEFAAKYWKPMKEDEYLLDNSVCTEISFNINDLNNITSKNIKTKIGARKAGY